MLSFAPDAAPVTIALGLFLGSFLLEDAALAAGALLIATGMLPVGLGVTALLAGILLGDLGLYAAGRAARSTSLFRGWIMRPKVARFLAEPPPRLWLAMLGARFVPGSRLPVYFGAGLTGYPLRHAAAMLLAANLLWTVPVLLLGGAVRG